MNKLLTANFFRMFKNKLFWEVYYLWLLLELGFLL